MFDTDALVRYRNTYMSNEYKDREDKLHQLQESRTNPYPSDVERSHRIGEVLSVFDTLVSEQTQIVIAGRIRSLRRHGQSTFLDLEDESGKLQCYAKADVLGDASYRLLETSLDEADFLEVTGTATVTKRGEKTILATTIRLLAKTLRPLPSQWYGFKDVEDRFRKRYIDLLLNPEVRHRFDLRSKMITAIRQFFDSKNFTEVSTPTLQPVYGGGFARPFKTHHNALDQDMYLCISDEMYLKRLIVGGYENVYEIYKVFRNEGIDHDHNPEFTMLEAQMAYRDYWYGMDIIEEVFETVVKQLHGSTSVEYQGTTLSFSSPWKRMSMIESIQQAVAVNPLEWKTPEQAGTAAAKLIPKGKPQVTLKNLVSIGEIIALVFEECVEQTLQQPTIIYNYPTEVSPLAKKCPEDPRFTQRFEYFVMGSELGNNYTELNDPEELKKRFIEEKKREKLGFEEAHQTDTDYLEAIEHGFPPACGLAIGIDRMAMMLTNAASIKEVIFFPTLKTQPHLTEPLHSPFTQRGMKGGFKGEVGRGSV